MDFKKAYEALKQGAMIKCPEWAGYWKWEDNSIKMHCKDGKILDIRETENVDYTLNFILRDDWEIVGEADVKDLDIQTFTFGEAIRRLKAGQKVARKGWNGKKQYIQLATGISYVTADGELVNMMPLAIRQSLLLEHPVFKWGGLHHKLICLQRIGL